MHSHLFSCIKQAKKVTKVSQYSINKSNICRQIVRTAGKVLGPSRLQQRPLTDSR